MTKHSISLSMEMSRPTRDRTAEPVSRDEILRRYYERGQGRSIKFRCSTMIGNLTFLSLVNPSLANMSSAGYCLARFLLSAFFSFLFFSDRVRPQFVLV